MPLAYGLCAYEIVSLTANRANQRFTRHRSPDEKSCCRAHANRYGHLHSSLEPIGSSPRSERTVNYYVFYAIVSVVAAHNPRSRSIDTLKLN